MNRSSFQRFICLFLILREKVPTAWVIKFSFFFICFLKSNKHFGHLFSEPIKLKYLLASFPKYCNFWIFCRNFKIFPVQEKIGNDLQYCFNNFCSWTVIKIISLIVIIIDNKLWKKGHFWIVFSTAFSVPCFVCFVSPCTQIFLLKKF